MLQWKAARQGQTVLQFMSTYSVQVCEAAKQGQPLHGRLLCLPEQPDPLPERLQDIIKGLNSIGGSSFSQGSNGQGRDGLHLLVLICQTMLDDVHQGLHKKGLTQS